MLVLDVDEAAELVPLVPVALTLFVPLVVVLLPLALKPTTALPFIALVVPD